MAPGNAASGQVTRNDVIGRVITLNPLWMLWINDATLPTLSASPPRGFPFSIPVLKGAAAVSAATWQPLATLSIFSIFNYTHPFPFFFSTVPNFSSLVITSLTLLSVNANIPATRITLPRHLPDASCYLHQLNHPNHMTRKTG